MVDKPNSDDLPEEPTTRRVAEYIKQLEEDWKKNGIVCWKCKERRPYGPPWPPCPHCGELEISPF